MSTQVQFRRGTTLETTNFTGASGEVTVDTTKNVCVVHDASKAGGYPLMREDGVNSALALGSPANCSLKFVNNPGTGIYSPGVNQVAIATAGVQRFLIDSSGNTTYANSLTATSFIPTGSSAPINGLYLPGVNNVAISTGGSGRLFVDASGRVGVGVSSPQSLFHVDGDATAIRVTRGSAIGFAYNTGTAATDSFRIQSNGGSVDLLSVASQPITLSAGGSEKVRITSAGLVGVGTSSPGSLNSAANQLVVGGGSGNQGVTIYTGNGVGDQGSIFFADGTTGVSQQAAGYIYYRHDTDSMALGTANTARLTIDSSGRVGIGTTSPSQALSVAGNISSSAVGTNYVASSSQGVTTSYLITDTSGANIQVDGAWPIRFTTNSNERARIDSSGRLLVGTSSELTNLYDQATSYTPNVQFASASQSYNAGLSLINYSGLGYPATLTLGQSGSNTLNTNALVGNGNCVGSINFVVNDGTNFRSGATVQAFVDSTSGSGDVPTRLVFSTTADGAASPTERMRLNSNGRVTLVTAEAGFVAESATAAGTTIVTFQGRYNATVGVPLSGTVSYQVFTNGNVQNTNNSYGAISDIKLKENVVDASSQWDDIKALQVRKYNFKEGQTHTQIGLVAQEVELVSPGLVTESPDRDEDGNDLGTVTKSVNYSVLYMKAVKALQEAMERIETLEAKVAALESK